MKNTEIVILGENLQRYLFSGLASGDFGSNHTEGKMR